MGRDGAGSDGGLQAYVQGGADAHGGQGAFLAAGGATGAGGHGKASIHTDNSTGNAADVLTADGAGNAIWHPIPRWEPLVIGTGRMPIPFTVPAAATAEDVANAINALLAAPQLVYADGDVVMVEMYP